MESEEKKILAGLAATISVSVIIGTFQYVKTVKAERAKREKIQEWKQMNLDAVAAAAKRMRDIVFDPEVSLNEIAVVWKEENEFMELIRNQPKY